MFRPSVTINGDVSLILTPVDADDRTLIALMVNGREVKTIRPTEDGGCVIVFSKSEGKK